MSDLKALIKEVNARWILDSRGNPTIETEIQTDFQNLSAWAAVPSGASTGSHEALELRDNTQEFKGRGVKRAIRNVNEKIAPKLLGMNVMNQESIDNLMLELDGTANKANLGANAILSVSLAIAKLAALVKKLPLYEYLYQQIHLKSSDRYLLPVPMVNILNGGEHAGNELAIQEFMILPVKFAKFNEALRTSSEIYQSLKELLKKKYGKSAINVGDEGGFAPNLTYTAEAFEVILSAIEDASYNPKQEIVLAIDAAASEFYENETYQIDAKQLSSGQLLDFYKDLTMTYPLKVIEDPFQENDFESTAALTKTLDSKVLIVGDDLFVSQSNRLQMGIDLSAGNAIILKVNQCGSLSEAITTARLAYQHHFNVIVSHRSGETEDPFIADLSVGLCTGLIKTGAPARGERTAKYNQILRIEDSLNSRANYAGSNYRTAWKEYQ